MTDASRRPRTPQVGEPCPPLDLVTGKDERGNVQRFRLHDALRRGPVIVAFFPGAFTSTCADEMACFTRDWNEYARWGAQFIGISTDSPQALRAWRERHGYQVPFASDLDRRTIEAWDLVWKAWWGPVAKRATFVVDVGGIIRFAEVQDDADPEPSYDAIKAVVSSLAKPKAPTAGF